MRRPERTIANARAIADWLAQQPGGAYRANVIRSLCRSSSAIRETIRRFSTDNAELRQLLPDRAARACAAERRAVAMDLRTSADQLAKARVYAELDGGDVSVRIEDATYLIKLLRRAAEAMP